MGGLALIATAVSMDEPQIGDTINAKQLGLKGTYRLIWEACELCGKPRWATLNRGKAKSRVCRSCNSRAFKRRHTGETHWNWKGGRTTHASGYIEVHLREDDFFYSMACKTRHHAVFEHRLVMAKHLGRCLQRWEEVHHKNGIKDDNRLENLELTTTWGHIKAHNKGYRDGYKNGWLDGKSKRLTELEGRVALLEAELTLLKATGEARAI